MEATAALPAAPPAAVVSFDAKASVPAGSVVAPGGGGNKTLQAHKTQVLAAGSGESLGIQITFKAAASEGPPRPRHRRGSSISDLAGIHFESTSLRMGSREKVELHHRDEPKAVAFSPSGMYLAVATGDESALAVWELRSQSRVLRAQLRSAAVAVAYAPSGRFVVAAEQNSVVHKFATHFLEAPTPSSSSTAPQAKLEASPAATAELSSSVGEPLCLAATSSSPTSAGAANEGLIAVGGTAKRVSLLCAMKLEELMLLEHGGSVNSLFFSTCGSMLAGGGGTDHSHGLMTKKLSTCEMKAMIWRIADQGKSCAHLACATFDNIVHAIAFGSRGNLLAVGGEDQAISILAESLNFEQASVLPCSAGVRCLGWSPEGRFLASGGEDREISVWDVVSERMLFQLPKAQDWYCSVAFSPAGLQLACCNYSSCRVSIHSVVPYERSNSSKPHADKEKSAAAALVALPISVNVAACTEAVDQVAAGGSTLRPDMDAVVLKAVAGTAKADSLLGGLPSHAGMLPCQSVKTALSPASSRSPSRSPRSPHSPRSPRSPRRPNTVVPVGGPSSGFDIVVGHLTGAGASKGGKGGQAEQQPDLASRVASRQTDAAAKLGMPLTPMRVRRPAIHAVELVHRDEVIDMAVSADGRFIVSGGEDMVVALWDVGQRHRLHEQRMSSSIKAVAYAPSGRYVVAGDEDSFLYVWAVDTFEEINNEPVDGTILSVAMSSSPHELLAVGTSDRCVTLMTVPALDSIAELCHGGDVRSVCFSLAGRLLAGGGGIDPHHGLMTKKSSAENHMKTVIWCISKSGEECKYLGSLMQSDVVHAVAFSPSDKLLAVAGEDRAVSLLLVADGFSKASELPCAAGVRTLAWSANSRFLASAGEDMQVTVWDVLRETVVLQLPRARDWYCRVAISPTFSWVGACGFGNNAVCLYPVDVTVLEEEPLEKAAAEVSCEEGPGTWITSLDRAKVEGSAGAAAQILAKGRLLLAVRKVDGKEADLTHSDEVSCLAFSPDGLCLAAAGEDASVSVWDVLLHHRLLEARTMSAVTALVYSGSGDYLASADLSQSLTLWHSVRGADAGRFQEAAVVHLNGIPSALAFAERPCSMVAVGLADGQVKVFASPRLQQLALLPADTTCVRSLSLSPTGDVLAIAGSSREGLRRLVVWGMSFAADSLEYSALEPALANEAEAVAFAPRSAAGALAVACRGPGNGTAGVGRLAVLLVEGSALRLSKRLLCQARQLSLAWSHDARLLVSGGVDKQLTVWDVANECVALQIGGMSDWCCAVAVSPDASWLAFCECGRAAVKLQGVEASTNNVWAASSVEVSSGVAATPITVEIPELSNGSLGVPWNQGLLKHAGTMKFRIRGSQAEGQISVAGVAVNVVGLDGKISSSSAGGAPSPGGVGVAHAASQKLSFRPTPKQTLSHEDEVSCLAFSPDGASLVIGGEDATIVLWDVGRQTKRMEVRMWNAVSTVAFSPCGRYLVAGELRSFVILWDAATGSELATAVVEGEVTALTLFSSGTNTLLGIGTSDEKAVLVSVPSLVEAAELHNSGAVTSMASSPAGDCVMCGIGGPNFLSTEAGALRPQASQAAVVAWSVSSAGADCKHTGSVPFASSVRSVAWAPCGGKVAVGCEDASVTLLSSAQDFRAVCKFESGGRVQCLAWAPDSEHLAVAGADKQICLWDTTAGRVVDKLPKADDWCRAVSFAPARTPEKGSASSFQLACCTFGSAAVSVLTVIVETAAQPNAADVLAPAIIVGGAAVPSNVAACQQQQQRQQPQQQQELPQSVHMKPAVATPTGSSLAAPQTKLLTAGTLKGSGQLQRRPSNAAVVAMGAAAEGFSLKVQVVGQESNVGGKGLEAVSATKSGAERMTGISMKAGKVSIRSCTERGPQSKLLKHSDEVMGVVFSSDGSILLAGGEDAKVVLWDVAKQVPFVEIPMGCAVCAVAYSPSCEYFAAAGVNSVVRVWHGETHEPVGSTEALEGTIYSIALTSRPKEMVAVGTSAKNVMLITIPNLEEIADLRHDGDVRSIAFSPDGRLLAGGGGTDEMHGLLTKKLESCEMKTVVWRTSTSGEACRYLGSISFEDIVHAVAFSPSGKLLAVGLESSNIAMLLVNKDFEKASQLPCAAGVRCLSWSSDSRFLASAGEDRQVTVWSVLTGTIALQLPTCPDWLCSVAFSPDREWLAACGFGQSAVLMYPVEIVEAPVVAEEEEPFQMAAPTPGATPSISVGTASAAPSSPITVSLAGAAPSISVCPAAAAPSSPICVSVAGAAPSISVSSAAAAPSPPIAVSVAEATTSISVSPAPAAPPIAVSIAGAEPQAPQTPSIVIGGSGSSGGSPGSSTPSKPGGSTPSTLGVANRPLRTAGTVKGDSFAGAKAGLAAPGLPIQRRPSNAAIIAMGPSEGFNFKVQLVGEKGEASAGLVSMWSRASVSPEHTLGLSLKDASIRRPSPSQRSVAKLQHNDEIMGVVFSPDGSRLLAGGEDTKVVLWDVVQHTPIVEVAMGSAVCAVAYSPSSKFFAAAGVNSVVRIWSAVSHECVGTSAELDGTIYSIAITSQPQEVVAVGSSAKNVMLISIPGMEELADLRHDGDVRSICFSPDGRMLAGGGGTDEMHGLMTKKSQSCEMKTVVWRTAGRGEDCKYLGSIAFEDIVHAVVFSPTGKLLAAGLESCTIAMLLVDKDFEKATQLPCAAGVRCLSWCSDPRFLASSGEDLQVSVWDVVKGTIALQFPKFPDWVCSIACSPDSKWLAACGFGTSFVSVFPVEITEDTGQDDEVEEQAAAQEEDEEDEEDGRADGSDDDRGCLAAAPGEGALPGVMLSVVMPPSGTPAVQTPSVRAPPPAISISVPDVTAAVPPSPGLQPPGTSPLMSAGTVKWSP